VGRRTGRTQCPLDTAVLLFGQFMKMRPELVVQTLAALNVHLRNFPAGGILSAGVNPSVGGSKVGCNFGLRPRISSGTHRCDVSVSGRGCCGGLWLRTVSFSGLPFVVGF
jgi:hypothetical protein